MGLASVFVTLSALTLNVALHGRAGLRAESRTVQLRMKQATRRAKGFGAAPIKVKVKKVPVVPLDPAVSAALDALKDGEQSLERYLNPKHFEDPETMRDIARRLQGGEVVVLRDAFRPEFAEAAYSELSANTVDWTLNEAWFPDGYAHQHHNVYDTERWSARLNATFGVFADAASKRFMQELTGRDCSGATVGAPSWYKAGDHSLPHTDWVGQRTVSYVWHLSKNWKPEWGGALYWAQNDHAVATYPASFNTLVLFVVTTKSAHFVTTVSPHHKGKRLTFNGWWQSGWEPRADDNFEERLATEAQRRQVTHTQLQALTDLVNDPWQNIEADKRSRLAEMRTSIMEDFFPSGARAGIEA